MIYNPNYQLLVANSNYDSDASQQKGDLIDGGVAALSSMEEGQIAIVNEDAPSSAISSGWGSLKRFSLYQKTRNDKGRVVIIKHSGAKPILTDHIRTKTFKQYSAGTGQYWQLVLPFSFEACCQDYTVEFNIQNEQIMKSQFPNYLMQEVSVTKECCESMCSNYTNPFDRCELAFAMWREVALNKNGYVHAYLAYEASDAMKAVFTKYDDFGNASIYFEYAASSKKHIVTASLDSYADGKITYTDKNVTDSTSSSATVTIGGLFTYVATKLSLTSSDDIAIVFEIVPEYSYVSRNINLKYDNLRNTVASVALKGGFQCNNDVMLINNMDSTNAEKIFVVPGTANTSSVTYASAVNAFAYPVGEGYDVRNMEQYDSRRTLNSPYPFSDYTFSESGIHFRSDESKHYHTLSIGYQQQSDTLTGGIDYPFGTTIVLEKDASHPLVNNSSTTSTNWDKFIKTTLGFGSVTIS